MKKILGALIVSLIIPVSGLWAFTVKVEFEKNPGGVLDQLANNIEKELQKDLKKYGDMPDYAKGMANSALYVADAATSRGYQGYDLFNISGGFMAALQMPSSGLDFDKVKNDLKDKGDSYVGVGVQPLAGQVGINMGFLMEDLYLSLKFGKFNSDWFVDSSSDEKGKVTYNSGIFGIMANYLILPGDSFAAGSVVWRGVTAGMGFTYSSCKTNYGLKLDTIDVNDGTTGPTALKAKVDQSITFAVESKNYIIPVELYTSVRLLYLLNVGAGFGFDLAVGSDTDVDVRSDGDAKVTSVIQKDTPGTITIEDGGARNKKSNVFNARLMANVGLSAGPVYFDVPVSFYLDNGYSIGFTAGIVW